MIRRVEADDWELLRDIRLRALLEDPDAFLATHAQESAMADRQWQQRATQPNGASFVVVEEAGALGLATGLVAEDPRTVVLVGMWVARALRGTGIAR
jgi:RimJ/RimL family protein N-acetyltransferase